MVLVPRSLVAVSAYRASRRSIWKLFIAECFPQRFSEQNVMVINDSLLFLERHAGNNANYS